MSVLHCTGPLFSVHCPQSLEWLLTFPSPSPVSLGVHNTASDFAEEKGQVRKGVRQVPSLHPRPCLCSSKVLSGSCRITFCRHGTSSHQQTNRLSFLILNEINRTLSHLRLQSRCSSFPITKLLERRVYSHASRFLLDPVLLNPPQSVHQHHRAQNHQWPLLTPQLT